MKSSKAIVGIVFVIIFLMGTGFIMVEFGDKSNDNPPTDQGQPVAADTPINPIPTEPASNPVTNETPVTTVPVTVKTVNTVPANTPAQPSSPYADGTYSADGSYDSPAGPESIAVSITLKDGIIIDSSVGNKADNRTSSRYQNMFIAGYKTYVVGKGIASVRVGKVSGSSLTGAGFNAALAKIKTEATA